MKNSDKKTIILSISSLIAILLLSYYNKIDEGEVIEKIVQKAHIEVKMIPSAGGTMRPQLIHYDDRWFVIIKNNSITNKCKISEEKWLKLQVGDRVNCRVLNNKN